MKRFALLIGTVVLSVPMIGCGGTPAATGQGGDDSNLPSEVKEYEARRGAERAAKKAPPRPAKTTVRGGEPGAR